MKDKMIEAKYSGKCCVCGKPVAQGDTVMWQPGEGVACLKHFRQGRMSRKGGYLMDVVVTVPKSLWADWIDEGDAAGESAGSSPLGPDEEWGFYTRGRPAITPGERVYIVAHGKLRGYAPLTALRFHEGRTVLCRKGDAVAVTLPESIRGFQGWRYRWWERQDEVPFPQWKTP